MAFLSGITATAFALTGTSLLILAIWAETGQEWLGLCEFPVHDLFFGH
jgi:hypothetical protein